MPMGALFVTIGEVRCMSANSVTPGSPAVEVRARTSGTAARSRSSTAAAGEDTRRDDCGALCDRTFATRTTPRFQRRAAEHGADVEERLLRSPAAIVLAMAMAAAPEDRKPINDQAASCPSEPPPNTGTSPNATVPSAMLQNPAARSRSRTRPSTTKRTLARMATSAATTAIAVSKASRASGSAYVDVNESRTAATAPWRTRAGRRA